jgi:hypothetical protein
MGSLGFRSAHSNFAIYRAKAVPKTYLVSLTSAHGYDADVPAHPKQFEFEFHIDSLAQALRAACVVNNGAPVPVTLKVHGFNCSRKMFEEEVLNDGDPATCPGAPRSATRKPGFDPEREPFRPADRFLMGTRWESEGLGSGQSLSDTWEALWSSLVIGLLLLLAPLEALVRLDHGIRFAPARTPASSFAERALHAVLSPYSNLALVAILFGMGCLFLALRLSTYLRDRYRALHYGISDLGEFMRELEQTLIELDDAAAQAAPPGVAKLHTRLRLDIIGHIIGTLLLVNAFRIMSEFVHARGPRGPESHAIGARKTPELGTLICVAPTFRPSWQRPTTKLLSRDVAPLRLIHVLSNDQDIIPAAVLARELGVEPRFTCRAVSPATCCS